jgi:Flp pilus assembly CpaE family ATPase
LVPSQGLGALLEREAVDIDRASVEAVLTQHPSGLRLLSGADEPLDPARALVILNHLASLGEACVLDLGWSVSAAGRAIAPRSDEFVLAIDSDRVTLTQAVRAIHTLNDAGLPADALKLVWVNRLGTPADIGQTAIRALLGRDPTVAIGPAAEAMTHSLELGQPLVLGQPDHPAAAQLRTLASSLMNTAS